MALTLGLTGMDQATEHSLRAAFAEARSRVGHWALVAEAEADYVIVDMDSMYGPMSWLRLHAAGKKVVGLTSAPRTQADFHLPRPYDVRLLTVVLTQMMSMEGVEPQEVAPAAPAPAPAAPPPPPPAPAAVAPPPPPPPPAAVAPPPPAPVAPPAPAPAAPAPVNVAPLSAPGTAPAAPAAPAPAAEPAPVAEAPASRGAAFSQWLRPGALSGRARIQVGKCPALFIDFNARVYHGPSALKALAEAYAVPVGLRDFEQLDEAQWRAGTASLGEALPLVRLQWYGGLLAGEGQLVAGLDPEGRYILTKWPQTEREFPRHFRIATAMMKGPATIAEIAAASGVENADVADFINANIATGYAQPAGAEGAAVAEAARQGGVLDRLRGR